MTGAAGAFEKSEKSIFYHWLKVSRPPMGAGLSDLLIITVTRKLGGLLFRFAGCRRAGVCRLDWHENIAVGWRAD